MRNTSSPKYNPCMPVRLSAVNESSTDTMHKHVDAVIRWRSEKKTACTDGAP